MELETIKKEIKDLALDIRQDFVVDALMAFFHADKNVLDNLMASTQSLKEKEFMTKVGIYRLLSIITNMKDK